MGLLKNLVRYIKFKKNIPSYTINKINKNDDVIFITRGDLIGDYIYTRNFLQLLRKTEKFKHYKFVLCCNIAVKDIALEFDSYFVDEFIFFNPALMKSSGYLKYLSKKINKYRYKAAINYRTIGLYQSDKIMSIVSAREKIGIKYNQTDETYTKVFDKNTNIFGADFEEFTEFITDEHVELKKSEIKLDDKKLKKPGFVQPYAIFFPSASSKIKRMDFSAFYEIAKHIREKNNNLRDIYICGSKEDVQIFKDYDLKRYGIKNICGKYKLSELFYIFKNASLIVTNETCAVHIATSVGVERMMVFCNVYPPVLEDMTAEKDENGEMIYFNNHKYQGAYYLYPQISIKAMLNGDSVHLVDENLGGISHKDICHVLDKLIKDIQYEQ